MVSSPTGLDYSSGRPSGASLKAHGVSFVIRYTDAPTRWAGKHITPSEYTDLRAHGIAVYLVIERGTGDWLGGRAAGRSLAGAARLGADAVGYPAGMPIFVTVDEHVSIGDVPRTVQFVRGAADVLGHGATGAYGFSEHIDAVATANACAWLWQPGSRSSLHPKTHVYQANDRPNWVIDGVPCDVNEMCHPLPNGPQEQTMDAELAARLNALEDAVHHDAGMVISGDATHPNNLTYTRTQLFGRPPAPGVPAVQGVLPALSARLDDIEVSVGQSASVLAQVASMVSDLPAQQNPAVVIDYVALAAALLDQIAVRRGGQA